MKKVVLKQTEEVSIDSITDESIVGIQFGGKVSVLKIAHREYCGIRIGDMNILSKWLAPSVKEYIKGYTKTNSSAEVFVFDTVEELKEWLKS